MLSESFLAFPQTIASGTDSPGPIWLQGHYFPKFPAVGNLFVLDLSQHLNDPIVLTLLSLQGIVNRNSPQIYLILDQYSSFWLQYAKTTIPTLQTTQLDSSTDLISRFTSEIKGLVVYDPSVPDTINVATTIAGLQDRLIVDPSSLPAIQQILGSVDVLDLRSDVSSLGWSNSPSGRVGIYQWVYDNLWPQCDKRMIGVASPGAPVSSYAVSLGVRDYIVALHLVTLYLSPTDPNQVALYRKFLSSAPSPIPVFGWDEVEERDTVSLVSSYGDWVAVLSHVNSQSSPADLTVLSGLQVQPVKYTPRIDESGNPQIVAPGVYVTAYVSDGDSLGYDYSFGANHWDGYRTGGVPVGWTINPTLVDIAPLVWNYYMATAGAATFVAGASGAGYMLPSMMSASQLNNYLSYAQGYWNSTGLGTAQVLDNNQGENVYWNNASEAAQLYANKLEPRGLITGYFSSLEPNMLPYALGAPSDVFFQNVAGVIVAPNAYSYDQWSYSQITQNLLALARGEAPSGPVSYAAANLPGYGEVVNDPTSTSGQVRAAHSTEEYIGQIVYGPYVTLPPGDYQVTFRLKSSKVTTSGPLAVLDATSGGGRNILTRKQISTTDMSTDTWQDVSLVFNLSALTQNVEFRIEFSSGSADLYVDTIGLEKLDGWQIPNVNQPVFVVLELTGGSAVQHTQFLAGLASLDQRIHLLNTDEFFAAVNSYQTAATTTVQVVTKLLASNGNGLSGAVVEYYSSGWKPFGTTGSDGTVSMALPPGPYVFQISYAGVSQQMSQNVASDPNVVLQTVEVHSDSGKCTSYIHVATVPTRYPGGGWQIFTQDMELLPGTYMFSFSDGTANTSYTVVAGPVKHIH